VTKVHLLLCLQMFPSPLFGKFLLFGYAPWIVKSYRCLISIMSVIYVFVFCLYKCWYIFVSCFFARVVGSVAQ